MRYTTNPTNETNPADTITIMSLVLNQNRSHAFLFANRFAFAASALANFFKSSSISRCFFFSAFSKNGICMLSPWVESSFLDPSNSNHDFKVKLLPASSLRTTSVQQSADSLSLFPIRQGKPRNHRQGGGEVRCSRLRFGVAGERLSPSGFVLFSVCWYKHWYKRRFLLT